MAPKEQKGDLELQPAGKAKSNATAKAGAGDDPDAKKWRFYLLVIFYIISGQIVVVVSLVTIGFVIYSLYVLHKITTHETGRKAGLVILGLNDLTLLCSLIYINNRLKKRKYDVLSKTSVTVVISLLAIVQLSCIAVTIIDDDGEQNFNQLLQQDLKRSMSNEQKYVKYYHNLETTLHCCGFQGPEDYRDFTIISRFPPNVSSSCCPSYDADLSDFEQNKSRQICKLNRSYYTQGCKDSAMGWLKKTMHPIFVLILTSTAFVVILVALGLVAKFCGKKLIPSDKNTGP